MKTLLFLYFQNDFKCHNINKKVTVIFAHFKVFCWSLNNEELSFVKPAEKVKFAGNHKVTKIYQIKLYWNLSRRCIELYFHFEVDEIKDGRCNSQHYKALDAFSTH